MIGLFSKEKREAKLEAAIRKEMAAGLYHRALPFFLERRRYDEAAQIEAKRGRVEEAAQLYERGELWREAADAYLSAGDVDSAATALTKGNLVEAAAELHTEHQHHERAARLYLDIGKKKEAGEAYARAGNLERAMELFEDIGAPELADQTRAELAVAEERWLDAAQAFEALGDKERSADAWDHAGEPGKAALLRSTSENYESTVEVLLDNGDFLDAAKLLEEHGDLRQAAEAAFRGGDLENAIRYLSMVKDYVTIAKVYMSYGRRDEAKRALEKTPHSSPEFELAMEKLAALQVEDLNTKAAYALYSRLVERRRAAGGPFDDAVRRWIVEMIGLLMRHGKNAAALGCFETLEQTGLMNKTLARRRAELIEVMNPSQPVARTRTGEAAVASRVAKLSSIIGMPQSERYEFTKKIGQGGNGAIYLATDRVLGREVVIKMIINTALPSDLAKKWFFREAQVSARLNHPNIVTVYDLNEIEGQPCIAMEYVDGADLSEYIDGRVPMTPQDVWPILEQFADALQYAHDQNVVHRDIKLENIMMTKDGTVKLMDFGLAKAIQGGTTTMVIAGTPAYMSPEQILGSRVDHRTDIYASGVMLFYMLTGHYPYEDGNILEAHRGQPIPDPRDHVLGMQAGFEDIMRHALAKKKEERYDNISDLARDFGRLATRGRG